MIDFQTALEIAQAVRVPLEQAFLQHIGKQAAEALTKKISSLRDLVFNAVASSETAEAAIQSTLESDNLQPKELAMYILQAAKQNPDALRDILERYYAVKHELDAGQSSGGVSAIATGGSTIYQIVNLRGNVSFHNSAHKDLISTPPPPKPSCSEAARELLANAVEEGGQIFKTKSIGRPPQGGLNIRTKNRAFISSDDPRLGAKWEAALSELVNLGFIEPPAGPNGAIYKVTREGYEHIDSQADPNNSQDSD
jgi:hypothetical protein